MKEKILKYSFYLLSVLMLVFLLSVSRNAGISCDEVLHYDHSLDVCNYFLTHGKDRSALDTPVTNLKYYGQSVDNLAAFVIKLFNIEDIYKFRHLVSSFSGWLTILVTALLASWLSGYGTGIIVIILYALSPTFLGHSQNNLKDIPFALTYISGIFFSLKFLFSEKKVPIPYLVMTILSFAFAISIRAGGLILICYLFLFYAAYYLVIYAREKAIDRNELILRIIGVIVISIISFFLSTLLWPFALQNPVRNIPESYRIMADFPATFRQIFEGKMEWSDFMPWYYLIKSMIITIPLIVTAGLVLLVFFSRKVISGVDSLKFGIVIFSALFPVIFVMLKGSNLYSSWRQFLFIYPSVIILSASGIIYLCGFLKNKNLILKAAAVLTLIFLSVDPVRYMTANPSYWYIYFNRLAGGLKGAYGNYDNDYYYTGQTEASEWLINYLVMKGDTDNIKVKATFPVNWQFRNYPGIKTSWFRYEERSFYDWDYAIVTNRYISPFQLKNGLWPPENSIYLVTADSVPLCAVIERESKAGYNGCEALSQGYYDDSKKYFEEALETDDKDEMIFYNLATAYLKTGYAQKADSVLREGLKLNPYSEPVLMYLGNIAISENRPEEAKAFYRKLISINRKYFEAYVELAGLVGEEDRFKARDLLAACLDLNPHFKPAIVAMGDTYRESDPEIAAKYYELAKSAE